MPRRSDGSSRMPWSHGPLLGGRGTIPMELWPVVPSWFPGNHGNYESYQLLGGLRGSPMASRDHGIACKQGTMNDFNRLAVPFPNPSFPLAGAVGAAKPAPASGKSAIRSIQPSRVSTIAERLSWLRRRGPSAMPITVSFVQQEMSHDHL